MSPLKLAVILFVIIGPSLAGISVIAMLVMDTATSRAGPLIGAALFGVVVAAPVSYAVAKILSGREGKPASA
jgi:hypothetical protein